MAFEPKTWANGPDGETPITADELNRIEQGIADIELQEGPPGPKGDKGDKGNPGKDAEPQFTAEEVTALKALVAEE